MSVICQRDLLHIGEPHVSLARALHLYGREFILVMDHRPLCKIFGHDQGVPPLAAARMQRWALILSAYQYRIQYIPGEQNNCADCMPRLPLVKSSLDEDKAVLALSLHALPVTSSDIAKATKKDKTLATVLQLVRHGHWPLQASEPLKPYVRRQHELSCQDGCVLWGHRVVIPVSLRPRLLEELHDGHIGIVRMKGLARSYIWWPDLDKDIKGMSARCEDCKATAAMPTVTYHPWQYPSAPWDRIHIDFGEWKGIHFLVVVDAYSKCRDMHSTTTHRTIEVLREIFATHGFPRVIVSDNGPQFTSEDFSTYLLGNHIVHQLSAPYHPATNGLAESMVKIVKQWLSKQEKGTKFGVSLSEFLRTYRNVPHTGTNRTPAEIIFGRALRTHISMVLPNMGERMKEKLHPPQGTPVRTFKEGDGVWVRDFCPSAPSKWPPGIPLGALTYMAVLPNGHNRKVHLDHLCKRVMVPEETMLPDDITDAVAYKDIPCRTEGDIQHHQPQGPSIAAASGISGTKSKDYSNPPEEDMSININSDPAEESTNMTIEPVDQPIDRLSHIPTRPHNIPASPLPLRRSSHPSRLPKRYIEECS